MRKPAYRRLLNFLKTRKVRNFKNNSVDLLVPYYDSETLGPSTYLLYRVITGQFSSLRSC